MNVLVYDIILLLSLYHIFVLFLCIFKYLKVTFVDYEPF